jgi:hypothetical protein
MTAGVSASTIAAAAATAASAASAYSSLTAKKPEMPQAPKLELPKEMQGEKAPDAAGVKKNVAASFAGAGPEGTMLTGLNGVAPAGLSLAKNTLLGA